MEKKIFLKMAENIIYDTEFLDGLKESLSKFKTTISTNEFKPQIENFPDVYRKLKKLIMDKDPYFYNDLKVKNDQWKWF